MRALVILVLTLVFASLPASADFDAGMAAYERSDFKVAFAEWLPLAEAGDAEAQYRVGRLYGFGEGVKEDKLEAFNWYRLAANQRHATATFNIGIYYSHGYGVEEDLAEAVKWFQAGAERGDADCQYSLGSAYHHGNGIEADQARAVHWYTRAARQGDLFAQGALSYHHMYGKGVPVDRVKGYMWFTLWLRKPTWRTYVAYPFMWSKARPHERLEAKRLARGWKPVPEG